MMGRPISSHGRRERPKIAGLPVAGGKTLARTIPDNEPISARIGAAIQKIDCRNRI